MTPEARPTLTPRGWGLLAAAGGLLVAARLFGSVELAGLGAAAGAAVGVAATLVGRAPMTYRGERWLAPMRVGVGHPAEARLRFTNSGARPTVAATATDALGPAVARTDAAGPADTLDCTLAGPGMTGHATGAVGGMDRRAVGCVVPALTPGAMAEATYDLPTGQRGAISVGPLAVTVADMLGLAERRVELGGAARLVVHPRVHPVLALPGSSTGEARHGAMHPARSPLGDDFFALREYAVGDDLRRVHWRSTARLGNLMLRQDELRFGEIATVLLDTRAAAHRGDSFGRALEVAASVAAALVDDGRRLRFVTTGGFDVELDGGARTGGPGGRGEGRWGAVLDHLAVVAPDTGQADRFALAVQSIRHHPRGPLAAVVGDAAPAELAALAALRSRLGLVLIAQTSQGEANVAASSTVAGALLVAVGDTEEFPEAWNQAVRSCGQRDVVLR